MPKSANWKVLSSRDVLDARPFLKVRVETIELPDGRHIPDYYQLEMPSFACILAETSKASSLSIASIVMGRAEWA
jgi:ADP-ribose pyrophosphatase